MASREDGTSSNNLQEVLIVGTSLTEQLSEARSALAALAAAAVPPSTSEVEKLVQRLDRIGADIQVFQLSLRAAVDRVIQRCDRLELRMDNLEAEGRRKIIFLHGVTESNGEKLLEKTHAIITTKMKLPEFSSSCILLCHRLGQSIAGSQRPRPILVRFSDVVARSKVWDHKTHLKGSGVTASEFLIAGRHKIFMEARRCVGVNRCWTRDGQIFVLSADGVRHRVPSMARLHNLVGEAKEIAATSTGNTNTSSSASAVKALKKEASGKTVSVAQQQAGAGRKLRSKQ